MFLAGAKNLESKKEWINDLNVFPVPDGDTGTNMTLTIMSAAKEVSTIANPNMENLSKAISSGSLRGARGNSGVILSQLLRGFTKEMKGVSEITVETLALATSRATETAYKAVMKPKEGTILTVAKGISDKAAEIASQTDDIEEAECHFILHSPVERRRNQQTDHSVETKIIDQEQYRKKMKYTDTELEEILNKLVASTRSPRGRFSATASYPELEKRLKSHTRRLTLIRTFSAAAAVALLCLSVWTAYLYMQPVTIQTVSTLAETRTVCLPDGSTVTLNHYSSLSYPEKFKSDKREVKLNGEAYFEVNKNKKHPFIVQTETIDVQVLGTHFNVDAYQNNPDVKTTLLTGSVAVSNKSKSVRVILKPNEIAIYNKVEEKLTRKVLENVEDEISWRQGEFIFDDLPLQEIARELSNSFGATIHIADTALQNYRITARFRNGEDLTTILSVLHNAGYFDYSQNNKQIIITAKPD